MIDKNKKATMLNMFKDGFNPYRVGKSLKISLSTVMYNMNKWVDEGMLFRINPGSTPIICEPGVNFYKDNKIDSNDFAINFTNYDIINNLHCLEGTLINAISNFKNEIKEIIEDMGNGGLIQNKIIIDKKSLSITNEDLVNMTKYLKRKTTGNYKN